MSVKTILQSMMGSKSSLGQYINGEWVVGQGEELRSEITANSEILWEGTSASFEQADFAIKSARQAFYSWSLETQTKREMIIAKFVELLKENRELMQSTLAKETGKPLWEADTEIGAMISKFEVSKTAFAERCPEKIKEDKGLVSATRHKPHGVVVVLGPFNFPGHISNGHIIPALLAGNTIVFKPSEYTPYFAELMVKFWHESGLPHGVLNLVQGNGALGAHLVGSSEIDGVFFTGSSHTGLKVQSTITKYPNRIIALEMGGNNPLIIDEISDIKAAVYNTIQSAYITAGQRCTCARRLIVVKSEKNEKFINILAQNIKQIKVGPYWDEPQPFMGTVISNAAANQIVEATENLIGQGAVALVEQHRVDPNLPFITPSLYDITDIEQKGDTEIFGPVLKLIWVNSLEEAITEANNTEYGLSAGIFTDNKENYDKFFAKIRAGIVNWNRPLTGASGAAPFGGLGKSGNHRPSAYYAADYCSYPVASMETTKLTVPENQTPGLKVV